MRRQRRSITDITCENCKYLPTKRSRNKRKQIPKESDVKNLQLHGSPVGYPVAKTSCEEMTMDYSQLSDFEINVAVFEAIHNGSPDYKEGENGDMVFVSFEGDIVNGDAVEVEVERGSFNPCANPADSWPIIEKYRISIINLDEDEWGARGVAYCKSKRAIHENPLRAAMIVFLMMQRIQ